jgi:hypothetical protein
MRLARIFVLGCHASVGLTSSYPPPNDSIAMCTEQCGQLGLAMQAVELSGARVGCICGQGLRSASTSSCTGVVTSGPLGAR